MRTGLLRGEGVGADFLRMSMADGRLARAPSRFGGDPGVVVDEARLRADAAGWSGFFVDCWGGVDRSEEVLRFEVFGSRDARASDAGDDDMVSRLRSDPFQTFVACSTSDNRLSAETSKVLWFS